MYNISIFSFPLLYLYNKNKLGEKIISNYLSFSHALLCSFTSYIYMNYKFINIKYLLISISNSYFAWDTLNMIIKKKYNNIPYVYHHLVCLYMLYKLKIKNDPDEELITKIFYVGELSNLFNYIVYHGIKSKINNKLLNKIKLLQFIWFSYFRMYYMSNMMKKYFTNISDRFLAYNILIVYLMGIFWGLNQFKSLHLL